MKNIFIHENDEKDVVFDKLTDTLDTVALKKDIKAVFKKAFNNYIGYHLFQDKDNYYKIFILPKHISLPKEDDKEDEIPNHDNLNVD